MTKKKTPNSKMDIVSQEQPPVHSKSADEFGKIISIIEQARNRAFNAVNRELISMYWEIGKFVSDRVREGNWGQSVVSELSKTIQSYYVGIRGFSSSNIWRMKQFYETYRDNEKLAALLREISWTNHLLILAGSKTDEAREFYVNLCIKDSLSSRELDRQIDSMLYERSQISSIKNSSVLVKSTGLAPLRDNYVLEFLDIPHGHHEKDFRKSIVSNIKNFILEFGKDFTFIGEEYRIQVGNTDFSIDLLFYNRDLSCLVAIELKIGKFKPEHLGQLEFYLEALDRNVKKEHENPSVGLVLCATKDDAVVEYALKRSMSPTMIADYQLHLPDKKLLQNKLRELTAISEQENED